MITQRYSRKKKSVKNRINNSNIIDESFSFDSTNQTNINKNKEKRNTSMGNITLKNSDLNINRSKVSFEFENQNFGSGYVFPQTERLIRLSNVQPRVYEKTMDQVKQDITTCGM